MALKFGLRYKNADSTMDLNLRLRDVAEKGIVSGGVVAPGAGVREITITPFVCITADGGVVRSDATHSITPLVDGQKTYIVLRAKYNVMSSTTMSIQALSAAAYAGDPDIAWLHVIATVDLTVGGPYALIPAANVSYVERHAVDPQHRDQYRPHVATAATLATAAYLPPLADNRSGDLVYAMDTGSFYEWTGSAWVVADDGAITHRDTEHSNGVVGDSAANTLGTGAAGTDITINAVAGGSGYTVNGRYLTSVTPTTLAASTAGITRGLIQVAVDQTGTATASYRAALLGVLNLSQVQIVDISDGHPLGNFVLQTTLSTSVSWDGGQPFEYTIGERTRIFGADNKSYIDVIVTGVPANSTDTYTVSASANTDTSLLLCYAFWAGAVTLVYGKNKVPFGTTGDANISTAFKESVIDARDFDLHGNGVVSGGLSFAIAGPAVQFTGPPLVVYISGKRYAVPVEFGGSKGFTGIPLPANGTRYFYVDSAGVFQMNASLPADPFVLIAEATTVASVITSLIDRRNSIITLVKDYVTDYERDVVLRYASATRRLELNGQSNLIMSADGLEAKSGHIMSDGGSSLHFEDDVTIVTGTNLTATFGSAVVSGTGSLFLSECPAGTRLRFGSAPDGNVFDDNVYTVQSVASDTSMTLTGTYAGATSTDKIIQRPQFLGNAVDNNLSIAQPLSTTPSVISSIRDGQRAHRAGLGCLGINACPVTFDAGLNTVTIGTGEFFDFYGRRIVVSAPVVFTTGEITPLANGAYDVYWDSDLNGVGGFDLGGVRFGSTGVHGIVRWRRSLAFAVVNKAGGLLTAVSQCQLYATGSLCQSEFSIGSDAGTVATYGRNGNFATLKKALVFRSCYGGGFSSDIYTAPRQFAVYDQAAEVNDLIDFTSFEFNNSVAAAHLDGLHIYGAVTATTVSRSALRWGAVGVISTVPMLNFADQISSIRFSDLRFEYLGDEGADNDNCWLKNPGANMVVDNVSFSAVHPLYCLANYTVTASLGGEKSNSHVPPTSFRDCTFGNIATGTEMFALTTASMKGRISFHNCTVAANTSGDIAEVSRLVNIADAGSDVDVSYTGGLLGMFNSSLIESAATLGHYSVTGAVINATGGAALGPTVGRMFITDCVIGASAYTGGTAQMKGCRATASAVVTGDSGTVFSDCDFSTAGSFGGSFLRMTDCQLDLLEGQAATPLTGHASMTNVTIKKNNGNGNSNTALLVQALNSSIRNVSVTYTGTSTNTDAVIDVSGVDRSRSATIEDVTVTMVGRKSAIVDALNVKHITVENCVYNYGTDVNGSSPLISVVGALFACVKNNKVLLSGDPTGGVTANPSIVATDCIHTDISGNKVWWPNIAGAIGTLVSITVTNTAAGLGQWCNVANNTVVMEGASGIASAEMDIFVGGIALDLMKCVSVHDNIFVLDKPTATTKTVTITLAHASTGMIADNTLRVVSGAAADASCVILATVATGNITNNITGDINNSAVDAALTAFSNNFNNT